MRFSLKNYAVYFVGLIMLAGAAALAKHNEAVQRERAAREVTLPIMPMGPNCAMIYGRDGAPTYGGSGCQIAPR